MTKEPQATRKATRLKQAVKTHMERINKVFDSLSTRTKRIAILTMGLIMASACSIILVQSILFTPASAIETDPNSIPKNTLMNPDQQLMPLGKMKGEIEGTYKSFHVAVDKQGQLFTNADPEFSKDSLNKEKGWEPITREQLQQYQEQLHFIPSQKKSLRR